MKSLFSKVSPIKTADVFKILGKLLLRLNRFSHLQLHGLRLLSLVHDYSPETIDIEFKEKFIQIVKVLSPSEICLSGTGTLILKANNDIFYLGFSDISKRSLENSYHAWHSIQTTNLSEIVPSYWEKIPVSEGFLWRTEELSAKEAHSSAKLFEILEIIWSTGQVSQLPPKTIKRWQMTLSFFLEEDLEWMKRIQLLKNSEWRIGPCHRDLTPQNIMFRGGDPVLIDLDRFTWQGIQIFDLIHYGVELYVKRNKLDWFSVLNFEFFEQLSESWQRASCFQKMIGLHPSYSVSNLLNLYILERLSLEKRLGASMPKPWIEKAKRVLKERDSVNI